MFLAHLTSSTCIATVTLHCVSTESPLNQSTLCEAGNKILQSTFNDFQLTQISVHNVFFKFFIMYKTTCYSNFFLENIDYKDKTNVAIFSCQCVVHIGDSSCEPAMPLHALTLCAYMYGCFFSSQTMLEVEGIGLHSTGEAATAEK